jgi:hypothetical protein
MLINKQCFNIEYKTGLNVELTTCHTTCVVKSGMMLMLSDNSLVDAVTDI